jgi:hypothetical protein
MSGLHPEIGHFKFGRFGGTRISVTRGERRRMRKNRRYTPWASLSKLSSIFSNEDEAKRKLALWVECGLMRMKYEDGEYYYSASYSKFERMLDAKIAHNKSLSAGGGIYHTLESNST